MKKKNQLMNPNFTKTKFIEKYKQPTLKVKFKIIAKSLKYMMKELRFPTVDYYNVYPLVHIWGNHPNSSLYTIDDICIIYNVETEMYHLVIETSYLMETEEAWCNYLLNCLELFTEFMNENGLDTGVPMQIFSNNIDIQMKAPSIELLYTNFMFYVNAFCSNWEEKNEKCDDDEDDYYDEDEDDEDEEE
jgi:hypothetical protein